MFQKHLAQFDTDQTLMAETRLDAEATDEVMKLIEMSRISFCLQNLGIMTDLELESVETVVTIE